MFTRNKRKIGLALGSGGAKGTAHLGALKALEEEGVRFDLVAGTSIGSIVGAMYANGYSSTDTIELIRRLAYKNLAVSMLLGGGFASVRRVIADALGTESFEDLKLPFAAVATDVSDGSQTVLREGNLVDALLASSAMPPFFKGVRIGKKMLADGAFVNAVPADVCRDMGADFVIGIGLSEYTEGKVTQFMTTSGEIVSLCQKGFAACDLLLTPDLSGFAPTDVLRANDMYDAGYECARAHMDEIQCALKITKVKTR